MITIFFFLFVVISQASTVHSDCPFTDICTCDKHLNRITCNADADDVRLPPMNDLPSVTNYYFTNFQEVQPNAFENATFLANHSISIYLMNISTIYSEAFSASMIIPDDSNLSIYIEHPTRKVGLTLGTHAFNNIRIDRLHFVNIKDFNGTSIFDAHTFAANTYINELVFERSNLSGFNSIAGLQQPNIEHLYLRSCPLLTNLTIRGLPAFLGSAKTFEISGTGLEFIDRQVFQGWYYTFEKLIIKDNHNLKQLPDMVSGFLDLLTKLDLSNNAITSLDSDYDWSPYYALQELILKQQPKLDLFIKTDILKASEHFQILDLSSGIISENDENLIQDHVQGMSELAAINISYTNFTSNMVIDLLTLISGSANQTIDVSLLGHTLNDSNFCSYFQIFQQAPNLLRLELDESQECNCIVDLFYDEEAKKIRLTDPLSQPSCLSNTSRARCDISAQLSISECSLGRPNPGPKEGDIGTVAFIGTMVGLTVVLVVLLALGSRVIYRARKTRRPTILNMEDPVDNPAATRVDQPFENSVSIPTETYVNNPPAARADQSIQNSSSTPAEVYVDNPSTDNMEEPLESSF